MTWLFSKALMDSVSLPSSQAQEAEYSADTFSDGEPSAQWNVMPTPQGFWRNDKMMDASRLSQFGPTLRLLTEGHGEAVLTSFLAAFPARTYPQPEKVRGSKATAPASGLSSLESLAKYDPATSSWRTPQYSLLGDWELYSETWPRWGSMHDGECWAQPTSGLRINATESGFWQTPVADDAANRVRGKWNSRGEPKLSGQVKSPTHWPTPMASSHTGAGHGPNKKGAPNLQTVVKQWPTPMARDHKGSPTAGRVSERASESSRGVPLPEEIARRGDHGQLNPQWVEWLMGWPTGWTALKPLEMARFQEWQRQHSPTYQSEVAA